MALNFVQNNHICFTKEIDFVVDIIKFFGEHSFFSLFSIDQINCHSKTMQNIILLLLIRGKECCAFR